MFDTEVVKFPMGAPDDISGLADAMREGIIRPADIQAIIAKTEGNGRVNDYTRSFALHAFEDYLMGALGASREEVRGRVAMVMSGGCEGVMSPHAVVFARRPTAAGRPKPEGGRLAVGVAFSRELLPEELGTLTQVDLAAEATRGAMADAQVESLADVGYVQVKCPLLTSERINEARGRGKRVVTTDTTRSMSLSNGCSALGVAVALGEVDRAALRPEDLCARGDLYSEVASCSSGVELMRCEVVVMGNSPDSVSRYRIGRALLRDLIDAEAVREALRRAGLKFEALPSKSDLERVVAVFAKAGVPWDGRVLGRRVTLLTDSDLGTRPARAVVNAVIASVVRDPALYVSAGLVFHQGPPGGGVVAAIVREAE